ncbi:MAG: hypothetical protein QOH66_2304, partial [Actinomycetota bacterium]|nr:hypothetical protein [Actinomycetota bacterium]
TYGPDHPQVAMTLGNLGIARGEQGDSAAAVELLERALRIFEATYGPGHRQVARTLDNLGIARRELGEHAAAVELLERAPRINEAAYGPDHPHSQQARRLLASLSRRRRRPWRRGRSAR